MYTLPLNHRGKIFVHLRLSELPIHPNHCWDTSAALVYSKHCFLLQINKAIINKMVLHVIVFGNSILYVTGYWLVYLVNWNQFLTCFQEVSTWQLALSGEMKQTSSINYHNIFRFFWIHLLKYWMLNVLKKCRWYF